MAQPYVDDSNPFSRSGSEVEDERQYGSGGRNIKIRPAEDGVYEGTSVDPGVPGSGAPDGDLN